MLALAGVSAAEGAAGPDATGHALVQLAVGAAYGAVVGLAAGWLLRTTLRNGWAADDFAACGRAGPGPPRLHLLPRDRRQRLRRRLRRPAWPSDRRTVPPAGAALRRADRLAVLRAGLAGLRRPPAPGGVRPLHLADRGLRRTEPHGDPHAARRAVPDRKRSGRQNGAVRGLVRPRGLASIIFGLLAVEELKTPDTQAVVPVVACTVLLSVLAHGLTSAPWRTATAKQQQPRTSARPEPHRTSCP